ncbi:membrane protein [Salmonella enterica subsp. enterica]|uniref:Membrane protein n=1 Tax=Salmonella enterica I TaxID=59201 RepID=A0A447N7N8_SALET|nr:membrane protein [Salmonella enterica subsp. enterica]
MVWWRSIPWYGYALWVGAVALFYTGYLLYLGIPTFLNINREEGLSFSSSTLAIGVLVLEVLLAITVILVGIRLPPVLMRKRAGAKASNAAFADDSSVAATLACRYDGHC